jgi:hypothetical protein
LERTILATTVELTSCVKARSGRHRAFPGVRTTTLIIFCIDPRYLCAVLSFITEDLGLKPGEFIILPSPGGALHLCDAGHNSIARIYLHDTISFCFGDFPHLEQCVIISHEQCVAYAKTKERYGNSFLKGMSMQDLQEKHLSGILPERCFSAIPPKASVRTFYMRIADARGEEVVFDEIET